MSDYKDEVVVGAIEEHLESIMKLLEIDKTESNKNTPHRVAKMWVKELFVNRNNRNISDLDRQITTFPNIYGNDVVIMRGIKFNSMCEHHWLPFSGEVTVAYVPDKKIIGLSKIPRIVKYFSKKPTLQEKLGKEILDYLNFAVKPIVAKVVIKSTHSCVKCRGAESDCETVTQVSIVREDISKEVALNFLTEIDRNIGR